MPVLLLLQCIPLCLYASSIATTSLPSGVHGQAYSQSLSGSGAAPLSWSVQSGALPEGLSLSSAGLLSGTPTEVGTFNFTVALQDGASAVDTQALSIVVDAVSRPDIVRSDWRLQASSAFATSGSATFAQGMTQGEEVMGITLAEGASWTGTIHVPATSVGGMLTYAVRYRIDWQRKGFTVSAEHSYDSTDGVNGSWQTLPLETYRVQPDQNPQSIFNKLQQVSFDAQEQWIRLHITMPVDEDGDVEQMGLYAFDPAGRDDYWVCVGASIQEAGVNHTLFKNYMRDTYGMDPVLFNVSISGYHTDNWHNSYPNNLLKQVLDMHPRARYIMFHIGGNNVSMHRPYVSKVTDSGDKNLLDDMTDLLKQVIADGRYPVVSTVSFRDYKSWPTVNAGANEQNGSKPYNENIYLPLVQTYLPDQINPETGIPYVDAYTYYLNNQHLLSSDGVHNVGGSTYPSTEQGKWNDDVWGAMAGPFIYGKPDSMEQCSDIPVLIGDDAQLWVQATSSVGDSISYLWYKDGVMISGEQGATLNVSNIQAADLGSYQAYAVVEGGPRFPFAPIQLIDATTAAPKNMVDTKLQLDFGPTAGDNTTTSGVWNSILSNTTNTTIPAGSLLDSEGNVLSGMSVTVTSNVSVEGTYDETATFNNGTSYPLSVAADGFFVKGTGTTGPGSLTVSLSGLAQDQRMDVAFFGTREFVSNTRMARFTVNGTDQTYLNAAANMDTVATIQGIAPVSGAVNIAVEPRDEAGALTYYGYVSCMDITLKTPASSYAQWVDTHLPTASYAESLRLDTADADKDGLSNLIEYFAGTDPKSASSLGSVDIVNEGGSTYLQYVYNRSKTANVVVTYQTSEDMVHWLTRALSETVLNPDVDGDGARERISVKVPLEGGNPVFIRARATSR